MATAGMQVFDENGNLTLTVGTRVFKKLGTFTTSFDKNKATKVGNSRYMYSFTDSKIVGKSIIFIPKTITYTQTGTNQQYVWPFTIYTENNKIVWWYAVATGTDFGWYTSSFATITWDYGWY